MKSILKIILALIVLLGTDYLVCIIVDLRFNPMNWQPFTRAMFIILLYFIPKLVKK